MTNNHIRRFEAALLALTFFAFYGCSCLVSGGPHQIEFREMQNGPYVVGAGRRFDVGATLRQGVIDLEVEELRNGTLVDASSNQFAELVESASPGGKGMSLRTVNVVIHYGLPYPLRKLSLTFRDRGPVTLEINGKRQTTNSPDILMDVTGEGIPPVTVRVETGPEGNRLLLDGLVRDFRLGGADLLVDNLSYTLEL